MRGLVVFTFTALGRPAFAEDSAFAKSSACLARFRGLARDPVCAGGRTFAHWGAAFCAGAATPGNWAQGECDGPRRRAAGGDGGGCDDGGDGDSRSSGLGGGEHHHSTIPSKSYLVLVFLGVGLFLGTVSLFVIDHFAPGVPYTLALFALGMVLFAIHHYGKHSRVAASLLSPRGMYLSTEGLRPSFFRAGSRSGRCPSRCERGRRSTRTSCSTRSCRSSSSGTR